MFFREFSVVRVKSQVRTHWEFPFSLDECTDSSPLAGAFDEALQRRLDVACGHLPFAQRTHDGRRAWEISTRRGELDVWFTSDGSVFVEGVTSAPEVFEDERVAGDVEVGVLARDEVARQHDVILVGAPDVGGAFRQVRQPSWLSLRPPPHRLRLRAGALRRRRRRQSDVGRKGAPTSRRRVLHHRCGAFPVTVARPRRSLTGFPL
jgi:hypothetical protein